MPPQTPRTSSLLHPPREIAPLREAATVLLLRDMPQGSGGGVQVLMTRRSMQASFAPGAYVFPGGGVDAQDQKNAQNASLVGMESSKFAPNLVVKRASQSQQHSIWALAAIRESFEELGLLLARQVSQSVQGVQDAQGPWCDQAQIDKLDRHGDFYAQVQQTGLQLAADNVYLLAHWITDRDLPRRFDVPFLVARMPPGQTPVADEAEQFAPEWVSPADALARHHDGRFLMIYPTIRTLERLALFKTVDGVLAACASEKPLWTSCPRAGLMHGKESRHMEHEPMFGELALVAPYGQIAHELAWQHDKPVQLLKHVARLTAPNPSLMTGPGTNTYIVGTAETGYLVIDPGPDVSAHLDRLIDYTGGDICAIICTHSHADHSPGAVPLQARVVEASNTVPGALSGEFGRHICPIIGMASAATARDSAFFEPDIDLSQMLETLQNQELIAQYLRRPEASSRIRRTRRARVHTNVGLDADSASAFTLRCIHTPGHAANHLCLYIPEDGLLFSGDHILNGSTTVIDPPDGDMSAYLASLDALQALCEQHDLRFILPAHGYALSVCDGSQPDNDTQGGAIRAIAHLKAHRLKREAKVIAAMKAQPGASVQELVPLAYDDVDPKLWPIAARSLQAHVQRIEELQLA
jgi:recombination protein RecT